jgi:hypothetical protein
MMQRCLYFAPEVGKMYRLAAKRYVQVVNGHTVEDIDLAQNDLVVLLRAEVLEETPYYRLEVLTPCGKVGVIWFYAETIHSLPPFEEI